MFGQQPPVAPPPADPTQAAIYWQAKYDELARQNSALFQAFQWTVQTTLMATPRALVSGGGARLIDMGQTGGVVAFFVFLYGVIQGVLGGNVTIILAFGSAAAISAGWLWYSRYRTRHPRPQPPPLPKA